MSKINNLINIMLDLANAADEHTETPYNNVLGMGYKAFSSSVRDGCKEIIALQDLCSTLKSTNTLEKSATCTNEKILKDIFGDSEAIDFNMDEINRIKAVVNEIKKEWRK